MRTKLLCLILALFALPAGAADLITRWLVITNAPLGNTNSVALNGSTRTYTNTVTASPATLILQTNVIGWSATNTANQLTTYRVSFGHQINVGTNYVAVRGSVGENITLSIAGGFGFITNSTQTVSSPTFLVRVPITVEAASNQTSIGSLMVKGISDSSTNAFATNSTAISNAVVKGASPLQTVASPFRFWGRTAVESNFFATNGFTSALTNINPVTSNLVNYGNAIRSEGSGGNSLQIGSNALARGSLATSIGNDSTALGTRSVAIGNGTIATNTDAVAVGSNARATNDSATAIGNAAWAVGVQATAVGYGTVADVNAVAIGPETIASYQGVAVGGSSLAYRSTALGFAAIVAASHSNSTAIGRSATTTTTNQLMLGTSAETVAVPGVLAISGTQTNTTFTGTNILRGSYSNPRFDLTTLGNGNNIAVVFGTNTFIRIGVGSLSSAPTICGIIGSATTGGLDGEIKDVFNDTGFTVTFAQNTVDPVPANRINSPTGVDTPVVDQSWTRLRYDGTDARWKVAGTFPVTATATNAVNNLGGAATNLSTYGTVQADGNIKYVVQRPAITVSNLVVDFGTNTYECVGLTNLVLTNLVEETTLAADIKIVVRNTNPANMPIVWPAYGAQHGYYFRTNYSNPILAWAAVTNGKTAVISMSAVGTNIFASITEWP